MDAQEGRGRGENDPTCVIWRAITDCRNYVNNYAARAPLLLLLLFLLLLLLLFLSTLSPLLIKLRIPVDFPTKVGHNSILSEVSLYE
jgi:hypothetical protein